VRLGLFVGSLRREADVALATQLADRVLAVVDRLAVRAVLVLDPRDALALERVSNDR
jgi:hypothetical protein